MSRQQDCPEDSQNWPIWVVSLSDAVERRRQICAQFEALDLPFSFLEAVDGRGGLPTQSEARIDRAGTRARLGYAMSNGEYACALSHQLAYERILEERWPGAVILEDDVILTSNFRRFYETRSYEAAPLIQLFYFEAEVWKVAQRSTEAARLHRLARSAWMTVGYSISAEAAAKLRANSLPIRAHADWPCETTALFGHFITEPRIVLHPDPEKSTSSIADTGRGLIPEGFDFSAGYAKGWRRLSSWASWKRLLARPLRQRLSPGFAPDAEEEASGLAI